VQAQAQATLDRAQGHIDHAGNLRVGQAAEVGQHNNPLLVGRQALNHGAHLLTFQALAGLLPGVSWLPRRQAVIKGYLAILAKGTPPPLVNGAVTHDGQQPPAHRAQCWAVPLGVPPDGQEGVLNHIFRGSRVAKQTIGQAKGHLAVPLVQHTESGCVVGHYASQERLVGGAIGLSWYPLGPRKRLTTHHLRSPLDLLTASNPRGARTNPRQVRTLVNSASRGRRALYTCDSRGSAHATSRGATRSPPHHADVSP